MASLLSHHSHPLTVLRRLLLLVSGVASAHGGRAWATIGAYPGHVAVPPAVAPSGSFSIEYDEAADQLTLHGIVSGLERSVTGGWHVHSGYSCEDAAAVYGHYWSTLVTAADPWTTTTYTADAMGVAEVSVTMPRFSLVGATQPVMGRVIVFHDLAGGRVGCGTIAAHVGETVALGAYPDYLGAAPKGLLSVSDATAAGGAAVRVRGVLTGLQPSATGGWHVHDGYTCAEATGVGGHLYDARPTTANPTPTDPWNVVTWQADLNGAAVIDRTIAGFSMHDSMNVTGHTLVVHDAATTRVACGLVGEATLGVVRIGPYPPTNNAARGTLKVEYHAQTDELAITGILTHLQASANGGWHVHAGYTCDDAALVGDHYFTAGAPRAHGS